MWSRSLTARCSGSWKLLIPLLHYSLAASVLTRTPRDQRLVSSGATCMLFTMKDTNPKPLFMECPAMCMQPVRDR